MEEQKSTSITEAGAGKEKKSMPSWVAAVGLVIVLFGFCGILFFASSDSNDSEYQPTADDLAQFKFDSDRAEREQRQTDSIRDQSFVVREENAQPNNQIFKGLDVPKPQTDYSWDTQEKEEEAINHVLRGSTAARTEQTGKPPAAKSGNQQSGNNSGANESNNNQQSPPMFVYSRSFGGAKYTEQPQRNQSTTAVQESNQNDLLRAALGLLPAATEAEAKPDVQTAQAADKQTQLIYSGHPPVTVHEGEMLEAALVGRLIVNVEPSPVVCILSRDLFDASGKYVVFPANSRVIGEAQAVNYKGASRLYISFHRIILPNGLSVTLPQSRKFMKAMDETGAIGVASHVNRHWMLQFGAAIMLGVFDGVSGYAQRNEAVSLDGNVLSRTSENFGRVLDHVMTQYSSIMPTISVFQGKTMRIYIADDMIVSPYQLISERSYYGNR